MRNFIYQEIPENERELELKAQCSKVEEGEYKKFFSETERADKNKEYVKRSAELFRKEQEIKKQISDLNSGLKNEKLELNLMLQIVDNGFTNMKGKLFMFDDQEAGDMFIYDNTGTLVEKRRLTPEEREYLPFRKIVNE